MIAEITRTTEYAQEPHNAPKIQNIALEKACKMGTMFKDSEGHHSCCYQMGGIQVSLPVSHLLLQHLYLAPVYVTACDLEKSFTFDNKV